MSTAAKIDDYSHARVFGGYGSVPVIANEGFFIDKGLELGHCGIGLMDESFLPGGGGGLFLEDMLAY